MMGGFTVQRLRTELDRLIAKGHGRKPVCVQKDSFTHNCESDGCVILPVSGIGIERVLIADGDGGTKINRDGTESYRMTCLLVGNAMADMNGRIVNQV